MGLTLYFSSQYSTREVLRFERLRLERLGYAVQSRWLDSSADADLSQMHQDERQRWIDINFEDLRASDAVVFWSRLEQHGWGSGGRHVEFGYAFALNKPIILVGKEENLFHYETGLTLVPDAQSLPWALAKLKARAVDRIAAIA